MDWWIFSFFSKTCCNHTWLLHLKIASGEFHVWMRQSKHPLPSLSHWMQLKIWREQQFEDSEKSVVASGLRKTRIWSATTCPLACTECGPNLEVGGSQGKRELQDKPSSFVLSGKGDFWHSEKEGLKPLPLKNVPPFSQAPGPRPSTLRCWCWQWWRQRSQMPKTPQGGDLLLWLEKLQS